MMVLGVLTDGRPELLEQTVKSADAYLPEFDARFIVNDTGDPDYATWLKATFPAYEHVTHGQRRGLAGAVQSVWEHALGLDADYLFHLEGDWEILAPVPVDRMVNLLERRPHLAEVVLQRQPLAPSELVAGGVAAHAHWSEWSDAGALWVEEDEIFSLNPCVIPRLVLEMGWPSGNEAGMTTRLRGESYRFAFWGEKQSAPQVHHLGDYRAEGWSL